MYFPPGQVSDTSPVSGTVSLVLIGSPMAYSRSPPLVDSDCHHICTLDWKLSGNEIRSVVSFTKRGDTMRIITLLLCLMVLRLVGRVPVWLPSTDLVPHSNPTGEVVRRHSTTPDAMRGPPKGPESGSWDLRRESRQPNEDWGNDDPF